MDVATQFALAAAIGLAYVLIGFSEGALKGEKFDPRRALASVIAVVFLAAVDPSLLPTAPTQGLELIQVALTAFTTFGALYVFQKFYAIADAVYQRLPKSTPKA